MLAFPSFHSSGTRSFAAAADLHFSDLFTATDSGFGRGSRSRGWGIGWTHDQRVRVCRLQIARDGLTDARSRTAAYVSTLGSARVAGVETEGRWDGRRDGGSYSFAGSRAQNCLHACAPVRGWTREHEPSGSIHTSIRTTIPFRIPDAPGPYHGSCTPCRRRARPYVWPDGQAVRPGRTSAGLCTRACICGGEYESRGEDQARQPREDVCVGSVGRRGR
ncbi:hypothetical protein B0H14DRAFT_1326450 [Mycena olivaceomarginata]|nr:hypothetical protein B0H14DRAFT_1326450 [Mycena olivaceomarginata]